MVIKGVMFMLLFISLMIFYCVVIMFMKNIMKIVLLVCFS